MTYQRDQASRVSLVLSALGVEQNALAGLPSPSSILCHASFLGADIGGEGVGGERLFAQPEKVLRKVELPG